MGYQVMVLAAWRPSGAALCRYHECTLSPVATRPVITLHVTRMQNSNNDPNPYRRLPSSLPLNTLFFTTDYPNPHH